MKIDINSSNPFFRDPFFTEHQEKITIEYLNEKGFLKKDCPKKGRRLVSCLKTELLPDLVAYGREFVKERTSSKESVKVTTIYAFLEMLSVHIFQSTASRELWTYWEYFLFFELELEKIEKEKKTSKSVQLKQRRENFGFWNEYKSRAFQVLNSSTDLEKIVFLNEDETTVENLMSICEKYYDLLETESFEQERIELENKDLTPEE
jgi:hypothetical protein